MGLPICTIPALLAAVFTITSSGNEGHAPRTVSLPGPVAATIALPADTGQHITYLCTDAWQVGIYPRNPATSMHDGHWAGQTACLVRS